MAVVKLSVNPIYGWGWFDETNAVDVPPRFEVEADIVEPGEPFRAVLGQVEKGDHPLAGCGYCYPSGTAHTTEIAISARS